MFQKETKWGILMQKELSYFKMLEKAGFTEKQAEATIALVEDAMTNNVATQFHLFKLQSELEQKIEVVHSELKNEIQGVRSEFKDEMQSVRSEFKEEIHTLRSELINESHGLRADFVSLEGRLTNKMVVLMASMTTVLSGVAAVLKFAF